MGESKVIGLTQGNPATINSLVADFTALGNLSRGSSAVTFFSELSRMGLRWACSGHSGTGTGTWPRRYASYAHTFQRSSDPGDWQNPPVPDLWKQIIRETMPAYDIDLTPTRGMGVLPETFRKQRSVLRSAHPQMSFAAWGAQAARVTKNHALDFDLGEQSPLARIYDLGGWILMLGVSYENCTSLHLAEHRASFPGKQVVETGAPVIINGQRKWMEIKKIEDETSDFEKIGESFERETGAIVKGRVAMARALLMPQRRLVDYAVAWMELNRKDHSSS